MGDDEIAVSSRGGELAKCCALVRMFIAELPLAPLKATVEVLSEPADGNDELDFFAKRRCKDGRLGRLN